MLTAIRNGPDKKEHGYLRGDLINDPEGGVCNYARNQERRCDAQRNLRRGCGSRSQRRKGQIGVSPGTQRQHSERLDDGPDHFDMQIESKHESRNARRDKRPHFGLKAAATVINYVAAPEPTRLRNDTPCHLECRKGDPRGHTGEERE